MSDKLSADEIADLNKLAHTSRPSRWNNDTVRKMLGHIAAQDAEIAALQEKLDSVLTWCDKAEAQFESLNTGYVVKDVRSAATGISWR